MLRKYLDLAGLQRYHNLLEQYISDHAVEGAQSDWNETDSSDVAFIKNKPSIPTNTSDLTNDSDFVTEQDLGSLAYKSNVSASYTPSGTVTAPTIDIQSNTTTVNSITNVGELPTWGASVNNEVLSFSWNTGSLPTKGTNTTVITSIQSATATQPSFSGTNVTITSS